MEQWLLIGIATVIAGILGFILARSSLKLHWKMALLMVVWAQYLIILQEGLLQNLDGITVSGMTISLMLIGICGSVFIEQFSHQLIKGCIGICIFAIAALIVFGTLRGPVYPGGVEFAIALQAQFTRAAVLGAGVLILVPASFLVLNKEAEAKKVGMALSIIGTTLLLLSVIIK